MTLTATPSDEALTSQTHAPPDFASIMDAAAGLEGVALRTPLLESAVLNRAAGTRVLVKAENLQRTGSFKLRGAYTLLKRHADQARRYGVVAYSSGNHAQGVAEAARLIGARATILMPHDAPAVKVSGVASRGAQVMAYNRNTDNREALGRTLAQDAGAVLAPPYDHADTIAGQASVGLEAVTDARAMGLEPDVIMCCAGGGGLIAGVGLAARGLGCNAAIYAAEPAGFDDYRRSLLTGRRVMNPTKSGSICDAILTPTPGALTFAINRDLLAGGVTLTDGETLAAMGFAFRHMKLVLEPGGAVALAAALLGKRDLAGAVVLVIASGGNVDASVFPRAIEMFA